MCWSNPQYCQIAGFVKSGWVSKPRWQIFKINFASRIPNLCSIRSCGLLRDTGTDSAWLSLLQRYLSILLEPVSRRRQFGGINVLITAQEGVQWRMDIQNRIWEFHAAKVSFSGGGHIWIVRGRWRFYNNPIWYFLDLTSAFDGICILTIVAIPSTYLKFGHFCDIFGYHRFFEA